MADGRDPLRQLKDQLEDIQKRFETELHPGLPQGGNLLFSPVLKGFLAGYIVAKVRSSVFLGLLLGTCTGIYAAQSYKVPNIKKTFKDYFGSIKKRPD